MAIRKWFRQKLDAHRSEEIKRLQINLRSIERQLRGAHGAYIPYLEKEREKRSEKLQNLLRNERRSTTLCSNVGC